LHYAIGAYFSPAIGPRWELKASVVYKNTPFVLKYTAFWLFLDKIRESAIDVCTPHLPS
jgi:hypothetical protein